MCIRDSVRGSERDRRDGRQPAGGRSRSIGRVAVSYTHLRAHETPEHLVCRLLLEKKKGMGYYVNERTVRYFFFFWLYYCVFLFFFLMIRRPPRSTLDRSSAASDVYKRQGRSRSIGRV